MNFRPELAAMVMDGRKSVTRRVVSENPRSPYHPTGIGKLIGKRIAVCPGRGKARLGRVRVASVSRANFRPHFVHDWQAEGFKTPEQFIEAWEAMHGRDPVDVWRIELANPEPGA